MIVVDAKVTLYVEHQGLSLKATVHSDLLPPSFFYCGDREKTRIVRNLYETGLITWEDNTYATLQKKENAEDPLTSV